MSAWNFNMAKNADIEEAIDRVTLKMRTPAERRALLRVLADLTRDELLQETADEVATRG